MTPKHCIFAALCLLAGGLASCSSNDDEQPANNTWTLNVKATKGDTPASRALSLEGSTLTATWAKDETVDVRAGFDVVSRGTLCAQSDGAQTELRGTITTPDGIGYAVDDGLSLWFPRYAGATISYTGQKGTLEDIAENFDYAHAKVKVTSVDETNHVLTTTDANFENAQAIVKFTLHDKKDNDTPLSVSQLTVRNGETVIASALLAPANSVVWLAIPPVTGATINLTATASETGNTYTFTKSPVTFVKNSYYPITVKMTGPN